MEGGGSRQKVFPINRFFALATKPAGALSPTSPISLSSSPTLCNYLFLLPSCVLSLSQESSFFHLEVCAVCTVILLHQVCACDVHVCVHRTHARWTGRPPLHLHGGGRMAGDGAEASSSLPDFNLHPRKVRKCEDGDLDRSAVVSSSLPICLLLRESRVSGFASKGPALPGRPATERKKVCDHSLSQLRA